MDGLIDASIAITLRREIVECANSKFIDAVGFDDLVWPTMTSTGSALPPAAVPKNRRTVNMFSSSEDEREGVDSRNISTQSLKSYWDGVRNRYRSESFDPAALATSQADQLPKKWTVVSISVDKERKTIIVSRQRAFREPLIFCLPLERHCKREGGEVAEESLTYQDAIGELEGIIRESNESAKSAVGVVGREGKVKWWDERIELDKRLEALLRNIEFCWLGVFKVGLFP